MNASCRYCDETVTPENAHAHFAERHPGMEWELATWPTGEPALMELEVTPNAPYVSRRDPNR